MVEWKKDEKKRVIMTYVIFHVPNFCVFVGKYLNRIFNGNEYHMISE